MAAMLTLQRPRRSTTASTTRTDLASMPEPATTPRRDPRHHYARHAALKPLSNHPVRTTTDRTAADPGAAGAQSDMICAPQLVIAGEAPAVQNGGYPRAARRSAATVRKAIWDVADSPRPPPA